MRELPQKTLKQEEIDARPYHTMEELEQYVAEFIEQGLPDKLARTYQGDLASADWPSVCDEGGGYRSISRARPWLLGASAHSSSMTRCSRLSRRSSAARVALPVSA
jgi:hypothetical protein